MDMVITLGAIRTTAPCTLRLLVATGHRMSIASEEGVGTAFTVRIPLEGSVRSES